MTTQLKRLTVLPVNDVMDFGIADLQGSPTPRTDLQQRVAEACGWLKRAWGLKRLK
jgi:hypothetical protein